MDELPADLSAYLSELGIKKILAALLRIHAELIEKKDVTICLRAAFDVYAAALRDDHRQLSEEVLNASIPGWVFDWAVKKKWLPYPPQRRARSPVTFIGDSRPRGPLYEPVPERELTATLGTYRITDWYKADVMKRLEGRFAYWQAEALTLAEKQDWSPLRQQLEAFKGIKKVMQEPPEKIPEALVRNVLAQQYGIRPEDVTLKQIRFEIAGLFRDYPHIELVPSQPQTDDAKQEEETSGGIANREARLQAFVSKEQATIADVRRSAGVFKPNMQEWRRGELSDTSAMSVRIEDVLNGKTPLKRGKKEG